MSLLRLSASAERDWPVMSLLAVRAHVDAQLAQLESASSSARRRARRALVRVVECLRYDVQLYGAPTVDDVVRARLIGREDSTPDWLAERAVTFENGADERRYGAAARVLTIVETSCVAFPTGAGLDWCDWAYEHDGESPTPHERARALRAAREGQS